MIMTSNSNVMAKPKESKIVFNDSSIPTWLEDSASPEQSEDISSASDPWLSENVLLTNPGPTLPESVVPNIISEHGNMMNNSESKQRKRLRTSSFGNVSPAKCSASEAVAQDDMSSSSNDNTSTAAADTQPPPPLAKAVSPSSDTGEDVIIDDCTFSDDDDCVVLPTTAAPPAAAPASSPPIAPVSRAGRRGPPPPGDASEPVPFGVDEVVPVDDRTVLVTTAPDFCLLLWGAFQVRVLRGALRVHGALLTPARAQYLPVFALRVKALPPLLSAEDCAADNTAPAGVPALPAEAAAALERTGGTVLLLRRLPSHLLSLLAAKLGDTFTPRPDSQDAVLSRVGCRLLRAADELHQLGLNTFATSAEWEAQLRQLETRSAGKERLRVVFAGGKGVGKSSWMYHVLNLLLNTRRHVYVLDLDPGQAEFTPCACLSLVKVDTFIVGPSFTHLTKPVRSVFLGEVSVANDPSGYLDAAHQLATAYRQLAETDPAPLLINTMGWGSDWSGQVPQIG
ncbi:Polynucleotide 5'-hydroxyl-kinase grc3 [Amphibalanus amphitrite]|uniref:Polynucleotide 5'-hydroxyl-kinase grc3 n=1 Tax=Amphibalanus amphitrite TaxID=1232801 RepID=A0A6A4VYQ2_AMPAM|nr:Polynucleotide 5'-hydroxyl-kinase grc3 [Amphibalanus amphitrite]